MKKLEGQELYRRLQEARNARKLLEAERQSNAALREIVEKQEELISGLKEENLLQKEIMESQALRIEYLEKIVFGKSKDKKKDEDDSNETGPSSSKKEPRKRDPKSYQREIPKDEDITETNPYSLECCPDCHGPLSEKKTVERYIEDIVLPEDMKNPLKRVEKKIIETGWCEKCKAAKHAEPLNGSLVVLGKNVKIMLIYLYFVMRMSYDQAKNAFRDIYHLKLSDGEIFRIMHEHANKLTPEHEKIQANIRGQPSHKDETVWKVVQGVQGNYCWINTGSKTTDTEFLLGKSRGKGNAKILQGESIQPLISDDYAVYDGISSYHQLCWAHPLRKFRELGESEVFKDETKKKCVETYGKFAKLYEELRNLLALDQPFKEKKAKKEKYLKRFSSIMEEHIDDPKKLKTIKNTLRKDREKYFTFLDIEGLPMNNNLAERRLRHIVLKRKVSFGSKTAKGAKTLEKLFSVVLTWWWKDPVNFISNYRHLLA